MGNRMEDECCMGCGGPLLSLETDLRLCAACEKKVKAKGKQMVKDRKNPGQRQRIRLFIPKLAKKK